MYSNRSLDGTDGQTDGTPAQLNVSNVVPRPFRANIMIQREFWANCSGRAGPGRPEVGRLGHRWDSRSVARVRDPDPAYPPEPRAPSPEARSPTASFHRSGSVTPS